MISGKTKRVPLALAVGVILLSVAPDAKCEDLAAGPLVVQLGVDERGDATEMWQAILRKRRTPDEYAEVAAIRKPLIGEEREWERLIRSRLAAWSAARDGIADLYAPAPKPARVVIVLGNRGASDAFTHDPTTMGFDLAALQSSYGDANDAQTARLDRLFRHEYAHLMQKSWMRTHPYDATTPLRTALLDIWLEGLGNYHSMSERWRAIRGAPSRKAEATLAKLEPRFCARLAALSCASEDDAARLTEDLSSGRFDEKWGALTAALWLEEEMSVSPDAYRRLVEAGPDAIPDLARRHLPARLAAVIDEALEAETTCR